MSVVHARPPTSHVYQGIECQGASRPAPTRCAVTVLSVSGEIDASNVDHLHRNLRRCVGTRRPLIVDLSSINFLGVQGLQALCDFDDERRHSGAGWVLVTCPVLHRLLNKVLNGHRMRIAGSVTEALQLLARDY